MNWFSLVEALLQVVPGVIEKIHGDASAHNKQLMLTHILQGAAQGAAVIAPNYAGVAADASAAAGAVAGAVLDTVSAAKSGDAAGAVTSGVTAAVAGVAAATAIKSEVEDAGSTVVTPVRPAVPDAPVSGPGLSAVVPA